MSSIFHNMKCSFQNAWSLRKSLVVVHLTFNLILGAIFVPIFAIALRFALKFAEQPALADFDIAFFLLSPIGFFCFLILTGLGLFFYFLDLALVMALVQRKQLSEDVGLWKTLFVVLPKAPKIIELGIRLTLRILIICSPFIATATAFYLMWLTEYDINFYLTVKPNEFIKAIVVMGSVLALMAIVLFYYFIRWSLVLPLVLFEKISPRQSFKTSRKMMRGSEFEFSAQLILWFVLTLFIGVIPFGVLAGVVEISAASLASNLKILALFLAISATLAALINLATTSLTTGALANLILEQAGWPNKSNLQRLPNPRWAVPTGIGIFLATLVSVGFAFSEMAQLNPDPNVQIIAHRGAAGSAPENTMAAVHQAISDGADWIEIDVQETADGEVAVIHDSDFMKVGGENLKIWNATRVDLERIDVGSWFGSEFSEERTPLLGDVLAAARGKSGVIIELKYYGHDEMLEQRVVEIVEEMGMVDQVKIMSLKFSAVQKIRQMRPEWNIGLLASTSLGRMWELDVDFLAVNRTTVSHHLVRESRRVGKNVFVWTVNDPVSMMRLISLGVGGLVTDEPAMAKKAIADRRELNMIERVILVMANLLGLEVSTKVYRDDAP